MRTSGSARADVRNESYCQFNSVVPVALLYINSWLPDFVPNVDTKGLHDVCQSPYFCTSETFKMYDAMFPSLQWIMFLLGTVPTALERG